MSADDQQQYPREVSALLNQLKETDNASKDLLNDCQRCLEILMERDDQFGRRNYLRCVCSFAEAEVFLTGLQVLTYQAVFRTVSSASTANVLSSSGESLAEAELLALKEEAPHVDDQGRVKTRFVQIPLPARFRLARRLFERFFPVAEEVDYSQSGWAAFERTVKVRNRIAHPKRAADVTIADDELTDATLAYSWLCVQQAVMLAAVHDFLEPS